MSNQIKRKPKARPRASGKVIYTESPPHWAEKFLPSPPIDADVASLAFGISMHPPGHTADLRSRIAADAQLSKDLAFFVQETTWSPEDFVWRLFWDADLMHIKDPMRFGKIREEIWPLPREAVERILNNISRVKEEIAQVNATDFSPAQSETLCDRKGERFPRQVEQAILHYFQILPEILDAYHKELNRRLVVSHVIWPKHKKSLSSIVNLTRRHSLYEQIRVRTGKYHATRLHRLVNAAREVQGLPPIEWFAFRKWLNELKEGLSRGLPQPPR